MSALPLNSSGWLLAGDLATLHDLPALAAAAAVGQTHSLTLVIIDNHGGAIFDVAQQDGYAELIRQGVDWNPATVMRGFDIETVTADSQDELHDALTRLSARTTNGFSALIVNVPPAPHHSLVLCTPCAPDWVRERQAA